MVNILNIMTKKAEKNQSSGKIRNKLDNTKNETYIDDVVIEDEISGADEIKKLRNKLNKCLEEKQEYLEGWQRTRADFVNSKKGDEKSRAEFKKYANEQLILDLLPALDSFDMAQANKEAWESVDKNWREGISYIHSQILSVLEQNGVTKIDPEGKEFDPKLHSSLEAVHTENKEEVGHIAEVMQSGYMLGDKVIRPAKVKVFVSK